MTTSKGPRGWAVFTIVLGCAIAYPFLRRTPQEQSEDVSGGSDNAWSPDNASAGSSLAHQIEPGSAAVSMASQRADHPSLPLSDALHRPANWSMPDWAPPTTSLDTLVEQGAHSLAANSELQQIQSIPTWIDQPGENGVTASAAGQSSQVSGLANDSVSFRYSPWEPLDRRPFDSRASPSAVAPVWPGNQAGMNASNERMRSQSRATIRDGPGQLSAATGAALASQHRSGTQVPTVDNLDDQTQNHSQKFSQPGSQTMERTKHYVYQPGYIPDD